MTLKEIRSEIKNRLKTSGIEDFEYESWIFLEWKLGISRADYYMNPGAPADEEKLLSLEKALRQRERRVPLQYLMKNCEFMGADFYVDERVLIPRQDTECLVEKAVEMIRTSLSAQKKIEILDLCTGSGCIGISIKRFCPQVEVTLADISEEALAVAKKNASALSAEVKVVQSDLFENIEGSYDFILSNPPYIPTDVVDGLMPEVKDYEPRIALDGTEDGLYFYREIIKEARGYLKKEGRLLFEIGQEQGESLKTLLREHGFGHIKVREDLAGLDRIVISQLL